MRTGAIDLMRVNELWTNAVSMDTRKFADQIGDLQFTDEAREAWGLRDAATGQDHHPRQPPPSRIHDVNMRGYRVGDVPSRPARSPPKTRMSSPRRAAPPPPPAPPYQERRHYQEDVSRSQAQAKAHAQFVNIDRRRVFPDPHLPRGQGLQFDYLEELIADGFDFRREGALQIPHWVTRGVPGTGRAVNLTDLMTFYGVGREKAYGMVCSNNVAAMKTHSRDMSKWMARKISGMMHRIMNDRSPSLYWDCVEEEAVQLMKQVKINEKIEASVDDVNHYVWGWTTSAPQASNEYFAALGPRTYFRLGNTCKNNERMALIILAMHMELDKDWDPNAVQVPVGGGR